jgi:hypothetical protein
MGDPHAHGFLLAYRNEADKTMGIPDGRRRDELDFYLFVFSSPPWLAKSGSQGFHGQFLVHGRFRRNSPEHTGVTRNVVSLPLAIPAEDLYQDLKFFKGYFPLKHEITFAATDFWKLLALTAKRTGVQDPTWKQRLCSITKVSRAPGKMARSGSLAVARLPGANRCGRRLYVDPSGLCCARIP